MAEGQDAGGKDEMTTGDEGEIGYQNWLKSQKEEREEVERSNKRIEEKRAQSAKRIKAILSEHGISMNVGGCGCCGSPQVKFVYGGETIVDDFDMSFTMLEDLEDEFWQKSENDEDEAERNP